LKVETESRRMLTKKEATFRPSLATSLSIIMSEPELEFTIETPSPVTCMDVEGTTAVVGCEDGTLRRYALPEVKVTKAVMGLGSSVSWAKLSEVGTEKEHVWIASGMNVRF
jgi:hypothetical protein